VTELRLNNDHIERSPATSRVVIEYGIRYTVICGTVGQPALLQRRVKYRTCGVNRGHAMEKLLEVRSWQETNPLCPEVDAVIVTRTVTVGHWTEQAAGDKGGA
jgi:hypothetical protein